jgi:hypothetical protein
VGDLYVIEISHYFIRKNRRKIMIDSRETTAYEDGRDIGYIVCEKLKGFVFEK